MSEPRTDWTSARQRQFTRENIARYPDVPFPYSSILDLLDALEAAIATPPALDVDRYQWSPTSLVTGGNVITRIAMCPHCDEELSVAVTPPALDVERLAVVGAARRFLTAHDRVIASDPVTRDDTFAMKNAADDLRDVIAFYDDAALNGDET